MTLRNIASASSPTVFRNLEDKKKLTGNTPRRGANDVNGYPPASLYRPSNEGLYDCMLGGMEAKR